ncbi:MAG TPA: TIGR01212 family radical SAM protein, partial [Thauera aminoaromatica]|nr:TIGR01212 family radical SAM protein [Thauera aminoaromatica]
LILGLPGETRAGMLEAARRLSALPVAALKLHQLQLVRGTAMARDWERDPASVPLLAEDEYIALLADFVERLAPTILLQRLGSEVPPALKLAPQWTIRLSELAPRLSAELARRESWQGRRYQPAS